MRKTGSGGRCCVTQGASLALSEDRGVAGVEESTRGRWYMSNYGWFALLHSRNQHTIISYFPPIKKLKQQQQQEKSLLWTYYAYISSMEREGGFRGEPTTVHFLWAQKASLRHLAAYKCNSACSRDMTCAFSYLRFQGHILAKSTAFALQCNGRKSQWLFWEREQKGSCFFSNSFLCYLPMSMYLGEKKNKKTKKKIRFCIPPHLQGREIEKTACIFAISQTTISSWCVFFWNSKSQDK